MFESEVSGDLKWVYIKAKVKRFGKPREIKLPSSCLHALVSYLDSGPPPGSIIDESSGVLASRDESTIILRFGKSGIAVEPANVDELARSLESAVEVILRRDPNAPGVALPKPPEEEPVPQATLEPEIPPEALPEPETEPEKLPEQEPEPNPPEPVPQVESAAANEVRANKDFMDTLFQNTERQPNKFVRQVFVPKRATVLRDLASVDCPDCGAIIILGAGSFDRNIVNCPNKRCNSMILLEDPE